MKRFILVLLALTSCSNKLAEPIQVKFTPVKINAERKCFKGCTTYYTVVGTNLEYYGLGTDTEGKMRSDAMSLKLKQPVCAIIQEHEYSYDYIVKLC